jgi:hypothetical protein
VDKRCHGSGRIPELWAPDSVNPSSEAYKILARKKTEKIMSVLAKPAADVTNTDKKNAKLNC